jgi:peroxiredoxin
MWLGECGMKKIIGSLLLLLLIGVAFYQVLNQPDTPVKADEGKEAVDFTLKDPDGKEITLSDYKGKKVLLNFWATWCNPCKKEMPDMEKIHQSHPDVVVLAVNIDSDQDIKGFMSDLKLTFRTGLDVDGEVNKKYKVVSIPTSFFINEEGVINKKVVGVMEYKQMEEHIANM